MKPINRLKDQKGIALVIALIMLLVLTLIGLSAVSMTTYETNIAGNERLYNLTFYAADGGVENFRGMVSAGNFIYSPLNSGSYQVMIGNTNCNITYQRWIRTDGGNNYCDFKVTSQGMAPFPFSGSVTVESIIEVAMMTPQGYN